MGVERAVTRWHLQHQTITNEIATLETKLAQLQQTQPEGQETLSNPEQEAEIVQQLVDVRTRLHRLGPCPKPMMG
jgi:hypothetical protein